MKVVNDTLHINRHAAQFLGLCLFLAGVILSLAFRPEPMGFREFNARMEGIETSCAKPQKGAVTITAKDVLDAVRGKPLEFIVKTNVKG